MKAKPKPAWKSRIVQVQVASILVAVLTYVAGAGVFEGLGLATEAATVARNWVAFVMAILNAVTIGLRMITSQPIEGMPKSVEIEE